ncbi:MAG: hypothetical protein A3F16_07850 [Deltaproteobacteria bacterium RIFCSPHIGHO2_12_FULL_43_9]|nr:MAG: hypothetical protein A3F16_07850 [Deltaproteobacteria bacterium RIFCSPHIGHO2_12_FULL_43_9]
MNYPKVKRSELSNGMVLVTEDNPRSRAISLGFWIRSGSANELKSEHGAAHFVEHLMFKGTKKRSPLQIAREIERVGGEINAFTDREAICYHTTVLSEDTDVALDLLSDITQNSTFLDIEMKKERDVILEEIRMCEDSPDDLVIDLIYETMFDNQIFGRSIIGTPRSLKGFTRDTLWKFYKKTHNTGNMFVTAAGRVDHEMLAKEIESRFKPAHAKSSTKRHETKVVYKTRVKKKPIEQVHFVLGFKTEPFSSANRNALKLLNVYVGHGMGSVLFQRVREEQGLAYSVFSALNFHRDIGVLLLYAGTSPAQVNKCFSSVKDVVSKVANEGIEKELLSQTKKRLRGLLLLSAEDPEERMNSLGHTELYLGQTLQLGDDLKEIESVMVRDIKALSENIFSKEFSMVSVGSKGPTR